MPRGQMLELGDEPRRGKARRGVPSRKARKSPGLLRIFRSLPQPRAEGRGRGEGFLETPCFLEGAGLICRCKAGRLLGNSLLLR
eukprot:6092835-Pyramimonas_sp.AAC.1